MINIWGVKYVYLDAKFMQYSAYSSKKIEWFK